MGKFQDIEVEYEKNKELTKEDVNLLKDWMEKQPHLPKISGIYFDKVSRLLDV